MPSGRRVDEQVMDDLVSRAADLDVGRLDGLFADFLDRISDCVTYYDSNGILLYCNERARERFPVIADMLVPGTHVRELLEAVWERAPEGMLPEDKETWLKARLDIHWSAGSSWLTAVEDGQWVRVIRHRMKDGGMLVIHADETPARVAEQRAEEVADRFLQFIDNVSDGVVVYDGNGRMVVANRNMLDSVGPVAEVMVPGAHYSEVTRALVERGVVKVEPGREEEWIKNRLRAIENLEADEGFRADDGTLFSVSRFRTKDGGFLAIRHDETRNES